ncbi:MAG: prepilin-type N-terminal cleavage/methylation domain-containing protein [bacterium]
MIKTGESGKAGFSLVEVLIALAILAAGILVIAQMQVAAIDGLAFSRRLSGATLLAQHQLEYLRTLPLDTAVTDDSGKTVFHDPAEGDGNPSGWHYYKKPRNEVGEEVPHTGGGMKYYIRWRVEDGGLSGTSGAGPGGIGFPGPGQMIISVEVMWFREAKDYSGILSGTISGDQLRNNDGHRVQIRASRTVNY